MQIVLLFFSIIAFIQCSTDMRVGKNVTGSVTVTLNWGGADGCNGTCSNNGTIPTYYACSNEQVGNWMSGLNTFRDPLPTDGQYIITGVDIQFMGTFNCDPSAPQGTFFAELASTVITHDELPTTESNCSSCSLCFYPSPIYSDGHQQTYYSYKYGGLNDVSIGIITNFICISEVYLTLYYRGSIIELDQLTPDKGPKEGGTKVEIEGNGFPNSTTWFCQFGDNVVGATWINSSFLSCLTPESPEAGNVTVQITYDNYHWIGEGIFTYYDPKSSQSVSEILEEYWWVWLLVVIILGAILIGCILFSKRRKYNEDKESMQPLLGELGSSNSPLIPEVLDIEEIELTRTIGRGNFGEVFQGNWRGIDVAVKKVKLSLEANEEVIRDFEREADIMRFLRHPNIVQYLGLSKHQEELCIVTEFMSQGSLWAILHKQHLQLDYNLKLNMAKDICKGMNYLHKCDPSVIHRDLKTHNLLVDSSWKVKVGDFGLAKLIKMSEIETSHMTACGTPAYTAPEVLRNSHYTSKADIYSFGIVLWEIISEEEPHKGVPPFQVVFAVGTQGVRPSIPQSCEVDIKRIIEDCWTENPKSRPTFGILLERFQDLKVPTEDRKPEIHL